MDRRALPGAVFVPENTMKLIARRIAGISEKKLREDAVVVFVRSGRYKANTDQVVAYNHESSLPRQYPKADLVRVEVVLVSKVSRVDRSLMGAPVNNESFLRFLRENWDESLELDSPVTLLVCRNVKGPLVDYYANNFQFPDRATSWKD